MSPDAEDRMRGWLDRAATRMSEIGALLAEDVSPPPPSLFPPPVSYPSGSSRHSGGVAGLSTLLPQTADAAGSAGSRDVAMFHRGSLDSPAAAPGTVLGAALATAPPAAAESPASAAPAGAASPAQPGTGAATAAATVDSFCGATPQRAAAGRPSHSPEPSGHGESPRLSGSIASSRRSPRPSPRTPEELPPGSAAAGSAWLQAQGTPRGRSRSVV